MISLIQRVLICSHHYPSASKHGEVLCTRAYCQRVLPEDADKMWYARGALLPWQEKHTVPPRYGNSNQKRRLRVSFGATSQSIRYWKFCACAKMQSRSLFQDSDGQHLQARTSSDLRGQILHNSPRKIKTLFSGKDDSSDANADPDFYIKPLKQTSSIKLNCQRDVCGQNSSIYSLS